MTNAKKNDSLKSLGLATLLALAGCNTLQATGSTDAGTDSSAQTSGKFSSRDLGNGAKETIADAQSSEAWVYFDLDTGMAVENPDATNRLWDLGFRRFATITNGGDSGMGNAAGARIMGSSYASLTQAPDGPWISDMTVPGEVDPRMAAVNSALTSTDDNWYSYNPSTHVLTARSDIFYVVRSTEGKYFKIQMIGYYDGAGSPGFVKFNWAQVDAPNGTTVDAGIDASPDANGGDANSADANIADATIADASSQDGSVDAGESIPANAFVLNTTRGTWNYLRASDHSVVTPATPENSNEWDLAINYLLFRSNGGTSGTGEGGIKTLATGTLYSSVTSATAGGYTEDSQASSSFPSQAEQTSQSTELITWWNYSGPPSHTVSPKPLVYVVQTANGSYAKLRIWSFALTGQSSATYTLSLEPIPSN